MLGEILGESPAMVAVRQRIERLLAHRPGARQLPPILLEGETGCGKGLVARAIHQASVRAGRPFVDINCAALPETLVEAELFGFERGAFTDAKTPKAGLFQAANGGVIFLDEIGLIPDAAQRKLLKVIEDRVVRRLGSTKAEPVDAWIIAATNEDLESLVRERRFRDDLYHRLSVFRLRLPPLRERGRDVLLLADHFLARTCTEYQLSRKRLAADARATLLSHRWPGNVRELSNVIERAALLSDGDEITAAQLELDLPDEAPAERKANWLHDAVADVERQHLLHALEETGWNLSRAAALLGVPRNTLRYRIERLGLAPEAAPSAPATRTRARPKASPRAEPAAVAPPTEERQFERQTRVVTALQIALRPAEGVSAPESSRILDVVVERLRAFGARLDEVGFNGCTCVFGLEPTEDAPRRAAYAAIAVRHSVERGDAARATVRIAIDAAPVALSRFGRAWELDPAGRQALMAQVASVLDVAQPGEILVGPGAAQFVERHFEIARGVATVTGQPVSRVTGIERSGYEVAGRITRFVGRMRELETLQSLVNGAAQRHGAAVGIVGEPGVGKSRLLLELAGTAASARLRRLDAACVSYGTSTPFATARALLRQYLSLTPADEPVTIEARVARAVASAGLDPEAVVAPLASLLDALPEIHPFVVLPPQLRRQRIVEAASRLLLVSTDAQPLLVVVEDLHWMDPESQSVMDAIVRDVTGRALLVVTTYRPEYQHPWADAPGYEDLRLGPLSRVSATEMLEDLIGSDPSLATVSRMLLERSEGNPFFLEESVRTLVDDGVLTGTRGAYRLTGPPSGDAIPPTVRAMLAARIDRLPPARRRVLQCAAVIGRRAPLSLLSAVAEAPETAVRDDAAQLRHGEFLAAATTPDGDAVFTHAIIQDVAYDSLLDLDRRLLHGRVLRAMEVAWRDSLAEHAEVLAEHALRGEVWDRAVDHLRAAGANAYARGALADAIARYERALELVARLPASRDTARRSIDVRLDLHAPLTTVGRTREVAELYPDAERLARELDDGVRLGQVLQRMSQIAWMGGRYALGAGYAQQALAVADAAKDVHTRVHAYYFLGLHRHALGDYRAALPCFEWLVEGPHAADAARILAVTIPMDVPAWTWLAFSAAMLGDIGRAEAAIAQAIALAEASEFQQARVIARTVETIVFTLAGHAAACVPATRAALDLCERIGYVVWLNALCSTYGLVLSRAGDATAALPYLERAVLLNEKTGVRMYQSQRYVWWAEGLLRAGRVDDARARADTAIELASALAERGVEAEARLVRGLVALAERDGISARAMLADAAAISAALGARPLEAHARVALACALEAVGDEGEARRERGRGEEMLAEMSIATWWPELSRA